MGTKKRKTGRSKYNHEFKLRAVKLCLEEGYGRVEVANELGRHNDS